MTRCQIRAQFKNDLAEEAIQKIMSDLQEEVPRARATREGSNTLLIEIDVDLSIEIVRDHIEQEFKGLNVDITLEE